MTEPVPPAVRAPQLGWRRLRRCRLVTAEVDVAVADLLLHDGMVVAAGPPAGDPPAGTVDENLRGALVVPGFVDIHVHGAAGVDLTGGDGAAVTRHLAAHGTTTALATLACVPPEDLPGIATRLLAQPRAGARLAGVHLEGPFLDPRRRGAQHPGHLRLPSVALLEELLVPGVRVLTLAPELPGAPALVEAAVARAVVVALGHSSATAAEAGAAFDRGARLVTHLFNGMSPFHHREPGLVGAALLRDGVVCELIGDGLHVAPRALELAFRLKGAGQVALVSDAVAAAGMADGSYRLGEQQVELIGAAARVAGTDTLAGGAVMLDAALRTAVAAGASLQDAVRMVTATPAAAAELDGCGWLRPGAPADLLVLNEALAVQRTMCGGAWLA